ncbi:MAG: glutaminyl-peptide cyclotransferase [Acidobacteriota bacterium]|nr:glutaminyl-peptide cyclotransferase [Acidobacteriota bacterium]
MTFRNCALGTLAAALLSVSVWGQTTPVHSYKIVKMFPHDAKRLIMSDGSSALRILDPATFHEENRLLVRDVSRPISNLNKLEWIEGEIWANIWMRDMIARIDPASGQVTSWVDFKGLRKQVGCTDECDVLNGIAYDAPRKRIFVTGKYWPKLVQIQIARS